MPSILSEKLYIAGFVFDVCRPGHLNCRDCLPRYIARSAWTTHRLSRLHEFAHLLLQLIIHINIVIDVSVQLFLSISLSSISQSISDYQKELKCFSSHLAFLGPLYTPSGPLNHSTDPLHSQFLLCLASCLAPSWSYLQIFPTTVRRSHYRSPVLQP